MMLKINDSVHGEIYFPNYVNEIIVTKEFERLRNIKQLGISFYYFKTALHTRYQHSIGTAYMCIKLLDILETNSGIQIDENHKTCVVLAGLLHDLGHGPYSHLWEGVVRKGPYKNWTHEEQSLKMIYHMMSKNNIKLHEDLKIHKYMLELLGSFITGNTKVWERLLKPSEMYLTEIVSNKYCNVDVDKFDYILRDFHYIGYELQPFMKFLERAQVVYDENGITHIGYHTDDFPLIENLFKNRSNYHKDVYQLQQVVGIEKQLKDICVQADSAGFKFLDNSIMEIQECCESYLKLDDSILNMIRNYESENPQMKITKEMIKQLENGNFYQLVYEAKDNREVDCAYEKLVKQFGNIFCKVKKHIPNAQVPNNIPLYDDDGNRIQKSSNFNLSYDSTMIFCKAFDPIVTQNASNFLNSSAVNF